jgi:hypothetical protein
MGGEGPYLNQSRVVERLLIRGRPMIYFDHRLFRNGKVAFPPDDLMAFPDRSFVNDDIFGKWAPAARIWSNLSGPKEFILGYVRSRKDEKGVPYLEFATFKKRVPDWAYFGPCNSEEMGDWHICYVDEMEMLFEGELTEGDAAIAVAFMDGLHALDPNGWHLRRSE